MWKTCSVTPIGPAGLDRSIGVGPPSLHPRIARVRRPSRRHPGRTRHPPRALLLHRRSGRHAHRDARTLRTHRAVHDDRDRRRPSGGAAPISPRPRPRPHHRPRAGFCSPGSRPRDRPCPPPPLHSPSSSARPPPIRRRRRRRRRRSEHARRRPAPRASWDGLWGRPEPSHAAPHAPPPPAPRGEPDAQGPAAQGRGRHVICINRCCLRKRTHTKTVMSP